MVLKSFLSRLPPERKVALERFMPEEERLRLEELPSFPEGAALEAMTNGGLIERVHWSWLIPTLKTYEEKEQKLFLASLSKMAAVNLRQELKIGEMKGEISEAAKGFFSQILMGSLQGKEDWLLPIEYLPQTPLRGLLDLSKKELTHLIDLLSLYDVAFELRQIVETKNLKRIYSFLSEEEKKFLKKIMAHSKEPFVLTRLGLDRWDGNEETLRLSLHRRGLSRLAAALSGQDPDFVWYICHQLDIGRGNALFKQCAKEPVPEVTDPIVRQIEEILENEVL